MASHSPSKQDSSDIPPCPYPLSVDGLPLASPEPSVYTGLDTPTVTCFWALCVPSVKKENDFAFLYVDPRAQAALNPQRDALHQKTLLDLVDPAERLRVQEHVRVMIQRRAFAGSVIRCNIYSLEALASSERSPAPICFTTTDVVVSWADVGLALCFFHPVSNPPLECGLSRHAFDSAQIKMLWSTLFPYWKAEASVPVRRVFQILSTDTPRQILYSWPPTSSYKVSDFSHLVEGASLAGATSCTRRLRAQHTLRTSSHVLSVASILIPCGSIVLVCYEVTKEQPLPTSIQAPIATGPVVASAQPVKLVDKLMTPSPTTSHIPAPSMVAPVPIGNVHAMAGPVKTCTSCGKADSPEWRRGPSGHKTLCNACGLRYARSLSNKRKKGKDGSVITVAATGDPSKVPPSRGSGGGSRPGVHRRNARKRTAESMESLPQAEDSPDFDRRLASVLASLPHEGRSASQPPPLSSLPVQLPSSNVNALLPTIPTATEKHTSSSNHMPMSVSMPLIPTFHASSPATAPLMPSLPNSSATAAVPSTTALGSTPGFPSAPLLPMHVPSTTPSSPTIRLDGLSSDAAMASSLSSAPAASPKTISSTPPILNASFPAPVSQKMSTPSTSMPAVSSVSSSTTPAATAAAAVAAMSSLGSIRANPMAPHTTNMPNALVENPALLSALVSSMSDLH
ncbi:DNA-templated transcription regulator [Malassezia pachydermatis]